MYSELISGLVTYGTGMLMTTSLSSRLSSCSSYSMLTSQPVLLSDGQQFTVMWGGGHATVTLRNTPLKTVLISHWQVCNALLSTNCRQVCEMQTTSTTEAFNVSPSNGKHFHRSCDKWEKHHGFTPVDTYWLEVWGTRLWSVVSTWGRQHHCWGGRTSRGSSGRSPTRPWTTSCPHWDVSDKKNNH